MIDLPSSSVAAKELMDLYSGLRLPLLTVDERGTAQAFLSLVSLTTWHNSSSFQKIPKAIMMSFGYIMMHCDKLWFATNSINVSLLLNILHSASLDYLNLQYDLDTTVDEMCGHPHQSLAAPGLDVLLHVKWTVKEFDCNLTREMVDLIDREADMLNRGRPEKSFAGATHTGRTVLICGVTTVIHIKYH